MVKKRQRESNAESAITDSQPPKRRRQFSEQDQQLAKLYENLADDVSDTRLKAAKELLIELSPEKKLAPELIYKVFNRLIRGLCSGRKAARYGFFIAFTELLRQIYQEDSSYEAEGLPKLNDLVALMVKLTQQEGKAAGQERRDYLFGRLSAYKALIQASVLNQGSSDLELWNQVLDLICVLANDVPWLREECGLLLCDAVKGLSTEIMDSIRFIGPILDKLTAQKLVRTPEGVAVWLTVRSRFPEFNEYPKKVWKDNNPLHSLERTSLAKVMRENYVQDQGEDKNANAKKTGSWQQSLHFAWIVVFDKAIEYAEKENPSVEPDEKFFKEIWIEITDNVLFSESSSYERKFWGFQLFSKMLSSAPTWALPILFSSNLMRCLIGQRNESSKLLYEAATEPLKKMKTRVRQNPELAVIMVTGLTSGNGSVFFDGITKTKTLQELITLADEDAFEKLITRFESLMRSPDAGDQKSADNVRQALADLLLSGLRSKVKEQAEGSITTSWIGDLLSLFSKYAYLVPKPIKSEQEFPLPAVSPEGRVMYQHRLSSCLAHLLTVHSKDPSKWPWFVVRKIHSITKSSRPYDLALEAEKPVLKTLKRAYKITEEIAADNSKDQLAINRAFVLLFSLTLLQAYGGDPEAISLLEELETCYKTIEADESASGSFDQLIEILLSFLSKPVALFRKMAEQTFATFSGEITEDGLQSFIAILEQKESLSGQQELFDRVDSEEDEGGEDDSDEPIGSDVEVMEASDEADDDPLDDIDGSEDDGGIDPELAQFEHLLAETLKTSRPTDENGVEESSDGESMDDEQMMAIEPHLENIFKQRASEANKKKEKKDARETVIGFKKRVLDLLTIYVKQESGKPITMHLILPLLRLVRTTNEPSLAQKANEVLKQYYATCTKLKVHPVPADIEVTWTLLKDIHTEAHKKAPKQHGAACSRASLFVVKALVNVDRRNADRAAEVYCETQKDWFKKRRTVMLPNFFTEWISWSAEARKKWS